MQDNLSRQYLLYLRDMSRKVAAASAGDYSQVLVSGTRSKTANRFQRITDLHLADLANKGQQAYRLDRDQQKIGNGIFCGVGVLTGTYQKSVRSSSSLRIIASPLILANCSLKRLVKLKSPSGLSTTTWSLHSSLRMQMRKRKPMRPSILKLMLQPTGWYKRSKTSWKTLTLLT